MLHRTISHRVIYQSSSFKGTSINSRTRWPFLIRSYDKWRRLLSHYWPTKIKTKCYTVYPKKYAHVFCFAVLCCGYTLTDFPISIRLTSLALWQSNDCPSASKATLMNMDKYFMWIHYERLHNHYIAKHNKTVCIFLGIYCTSVRSAHCGCWWPNDVKYDIYTPSDEQVRVRN